MRTLSPTDVVLTDDAWTKLSCRLEMTKATCALVYGTLLQADLGQLPEPAQSAVLALGMVERELEALWKDFGRVPRHGSGGGDGTA
jgi:hypothetical protein